MSQAPFLERQIYEDLRRRLIDRTRRNKAVHFNHQAKASFVRVVEAAPEDVIARLQNGERVGFRPLPDPPSERAEASPHASRQGLDIPSYARGIGIDPEFDLSPLKSSATAGSRPVALQTLLFGDQLQARLSGLMRKAREVQQETGVSTLHLAFGFLEWFEGDASNETCVSPLLLLPVGLERRVLAGGKDELRLVALDNSPATNLSLELRMREDFRLTLPSFDSDAEEPVEHYIRMVTKSVNSFPRWRVRRFLTLAPFSFARIAMYQDLDPTQWPQDPSGGPLVRSLLRAGAEEPRLGSNDEEGSFAEEYEIDNPDLEPLAPVLVQDADSSQHSAIIDAMRGRNLVIEGPPGTGKSQTISNLIANILYRGGTVLFVSAKMAALEVVKARLDRTGLGHFCLPIHAAGAKPESVIQALRVRHGLTGSSRVSAGASSRTTTGARADLRLHLEVMHREVGPDGETVHALIGRLAELGRVLPHLPALLRARAREMPSAISAAAAAAARDRLEALEAAASTVERPGWDPRSSPFHRLERTDLFPDEQATLLESAAKLSSCCAELKSTVTDLPNWLAQLVPTVSIRTIQAVIDRAGSIEDPSPEVDRALLGRLTSPEALLNGMAAAKAAGEIQSEAAALMGAGVADPALLHPEVLGLAVKSVRSLDLPACRIDELAGRASAEADRVAQLDVFDRCVGVLAGLLSLDVDPEMAAIRVACEAARLAARAGALVFGHRRADLHLHASTLRDLASRQEAVDRKLKEVSAVFCSDDLSLTALRGAAAALRRGGPFAFWRPGVRRARHMFRERWRGTGQVRAKDRSLYLEHAAEAVAEQESFGRDPRLPAIFPEIAEPSRLPLQAIAAAAAWQASVEERLTTSSVGGPSVKVFLLGADPRLLEQLAGWAPAAEALELFLEASRPPQAVRWSAVRERTAVRHRLLAGLSNAVAPLGLRGDMPLSALTKLSAAHKRWLQATAALASPPAQMLLTDLQASAGTLRATTEFASQVWARQPQGAGALLGDCWTHSIASLRATVARLVAAVAMAAKARSQLAEVGLSEFAQLGEGQSIGGIGDEAYEFVHAAEELPAYLRFGSSRAQCLSDPLARPVVQAIDASGLPLRHLPEALDWLVAWTLVRNAAEVDRAVFSRAGEQLSALRQRFAGDDRSRLAADANAVASALLRRSVPTGNSAGSKRGWTDGALLENEFSKASRHIPVRDLLARGADAVLTLTPCLMMSPLTVAQYLQPGQIQFDFIIMDEASQIRPEDAIGAVLRGRQTVVVGDPKQLPPTNFFDRALYDEDESEDEDTEGGTEADRRLAKEDRISAESVLGLALRAFRPARRLRWHYRSQHEALIAFSNQAFYDSNLVVFPAAQEPSETLGIELVRLDGRWRNRSNAEEARALAKAVSDFMQHHPELSYGVVTMNQPQRELIEAEIKRLADSELTAIYSQRWEERLEPPFVKNLENVQGDERDVIFISLGWGRTPEGAMHQRFFPISRKDGERRLNVLFTRAKRKIVLFCSVDPADIVIDPEKTARGVRVLRDYLVYARDGKLQKLATDEGPADSPFETSVATALRARGHDIALQVGVAGYRVDLAVRHPAEPWRFLLGIECDGATYHSAKSARDRDRLRQDALERLGWRLIRVWSTDWFRNPAAEADRLSAEIARLLAKTATVSIRRDRMVEVSELPQPPEDDLAPATAPDRVSSTSADLGPPVVGAHSAEPIERPIVGSLEEALRGFRESVIMRDLPGSEPNRCILREEMIRVVAASGLDDSADFHTKVPDWLRAKTDGRQTRYLDQICDLVAQFRWDGRGTVQTATRSPRANAPR